MMFKAMASRLAAVAPPITATSQARLKVNDVQGRGVQLAAVAPPITATSQARLKVNDVQGRGFQLAAVAPAIFTTSQARRAPGLRCNVQDGAADHRHEPASPVQYRAADLHHEPGAPRARIKMQRPGPRRRSPPRARPA